MNNKNILILRYIIILTIIFSVVTKPVSIVDYTIIALTLLFIINNQIRIFLLINRQGPIFISLILEWLIIFFISYNLKEINLLYYVMGIVDSFIMLNGFNRFITGFLGIGIMIYFNLHSQSLLSSVVLLITLGFLSFDIGENHRKKTKMESLYDELRRSEDQLIRTNKELENHANSIKELSVLKERNRISREIHDSVGHSLSTIIIQLSAIEKVALNDGKAASDMANNLGSFARNGLEEIRTALRELKPREFEKYEIIFIIEELIKDFSKLTGVEIRLNSSKEKWPLTKDQSLSIYRVIQEFLSNSVKHGKATKINIFLHFNPDDLILTLQDNGIGSNKIIEGLGLKSITERIRELGGKVNYESKENKGFFLRLVLNRQEELMISVES